MKKITPRYKIGETLLVKKTKKVLIIKDYEIFDSLVLYYTNDKSAYPEDSLVRPFTDIFTRTDEEWEKINNEFFKSFGK